MPVNVTDIETAITNALPVSHLEINDQSDGCGESYSIVVVSEVRVHRCSKMR
jgi:stress-induced morphogen